MLAFSSQAPGRQTARLLGLATVSIAAPLIGLLIVRAPVLAWILLGSVVALVFLEFSPVYWVTLAIATATLSRVAVVLGAPHFLNFAHFPLALGAFVVALLKGRSSPTAKRIGTCLWVFLAVNILSWAINDGEILRPILNWLVLMQPFLLLYALLATPVTDRTTYLLWNLVLAIAFVQVPLGLWQRVFISKGNPDLVQGTFMGSGTGAHVAGAVALLGALSLVCKGAGSKSSHVRIFCLASAIPLFGMAVMADAKQVIVAFVPGLLFAIVKITGIRPSTVILPIAFLCIILFASFHFYKPLQKLGERGLMSGGLEGKRFALVTILSKMAETPGGWLLGLGPGNTVSRVALMTPGAQLDATSSISILGLKTAPVTRRLIAVSTGNWLWKSSSAWSAECSWFGLIGDLGLAGLAVYLWILVIAWMELGGGWLGSSAKGALLSMAVLGGVYSWLEEPGFTLLVVLVVGVAMRPRPHVLAT